MSIEVKVPVLPESVSDATVATWHKEAGDSVRRDENLVDLETDKVVLEVPAPCDGVLKSIEKDTGEVVTNDEVLAHIEEGKVAADEPESETTEDAGEEAKSEDESPDESAEPEESAEPAESAEEEGDGGDQPVMSPAARKLAEERDVDPSSIQGSGRDGRITKEDVLKKIKGDDDDRADDDDSGDDGAGDAPAPAGERVEERVPMSRLRTRIAERMVEAQSTAAMLTSFNEVDLQQVIRIREQYRDAFEEEHGVRLGFMSFFVKACCEALKKHPIINATMDDGDIIYHGYQDIGIAVSTDRGLVVPVLRNAERMTLAGVEKGIREFASQAREGSLKLEDLQGGTFTITNGGVFGSLVSTPILNMPQSAILGMHAIKERPVVVDGEIVIRPMMYIALTYDHRLVDGKDAVLFLVAVKDALEDPTRMLLNL